MRGSALLTSKAAVLPPFPPRVKMNCAEPVARVQRSRLGNFARISPVSGWTLTLDTTLLTLPSPSA